MGGFHWKAYCNTADNLWNSQMDQWPCNNQKPKEFFNAKWEKVRIGLSLVNMWIDLNDVIKFNNKY